MALLSVKELCGDSTTKPLNYTVYAFDSVLENHYHDKSLVISPVLSPIFFGRQKRKSQDSP